MCNPIFRSIFFVLLLIYASTASAAQPDTMYMNANGKKVPKKKATFFLTIDKYSNELYEVKGYSMEGILKNHTFYSSIETWLLHGQHIVYYPNGNKCYEMLYEYGIPVGESKRYYEDGTLWEWIKYEHTSKQHAFYYPSGKLKRMEYTKNDTSTGECYDEDGNPVPFTPYEISPKYNGDMHAFLSEHIKYPWYCRHKNISGKVVLKFTIDSTGRVHDIYVLKSVHPILDNEALRIARKMKKWSPGLRDNKPANFDYHLPVSFKLN